MLPRSLALAFVLLGLTFGARPVAAEIVRIGPEAELCLAVQSLRPGDELVLQPGEYQGGCTISQGGQPGAPIVIRGADPGNRPRIVFGAADGDVLLIRAGYVTLRGLEFGPTERDVDAVRIYYGNDVTVEDCRFVQVRGIAVAANQTSLRGLKVRRNEMLSGSTAMYFGCHDGVSCVVSDVLVERNYVWRVLAPTGKIGYGLEVKLNSQAVVRDNVIVDTKGPGIMVYGSTDPARVSLIERNIVIGSRGSSGVLVGGGPAVVRNNILVQNAEGGIGLQDYRARGLLRGVTLVHNTVYLNDEAGILLPEKGVHEVTLINNAAYSSPGKPALPPRRPGVRMVGNVDCAYLGCFIDARNGDFSPSFGSVLVGLGTTFDEGWFPRDDYHGARRGMVPTVGAIERSGAGPIVLGIKP